MIFTREDYVCLVIGIIGTLLCVYQLYLVGWDVEELLFGHTSEDEE